MNLDVLIPSLLLPSPIHQMMAPPHVPALERLLARAEKRDEPATSATDWLCARWGMRTPFATAPVLAGFDGLDVGDAGWLFAEPVHMVADRDRVKIFPAGMLELHPDESRDLVAALNSHFIQDGLAFFAPSTDRWYVQCAPDEIPATVPAREAANGSLSDFQPRSVGKLDWRSIQNEAQMLLFTHPVNQARDATGRPVVSGVWFSGGGAMPTLTRPPYHCVFTDSPLPTQLARQTGIDVQPVARLSCLSCLSFNDVQSDSLAVLDPGPIPTSPAEMDAWVGEITRLDNEFFKPLADALARGAIQRLSIHSPGIGGSRAFHTTRHNHLYKFWRRTQPLASHA